MDALQRIERALEAAITKGIGDGSPPGLKAAARHAVFTPGSRVRPRLCLTVAAACGADEPEPLPYEPSLDGQGFLAGNQVLAPLRGILGSRAAHGTTAAKELANFACDRRARGLPAAYAHFAMCETAQPPLGWVLSPGARDAIEAYLDSCANPGALGQVRAAFAGASALTD